MSACQHAICQYASRPNPEATVSIPVSLAPALGNTGQCSNCGGRFEGWPGGVCDACKPLVS